jgi:hypothetical protein
MPGYSDVPMLQSGPSVDSNVPELEVVGHTNSGNIPNVTKSENIAEIQEENRRKIVNSIIVNIVGRPYQLVPMPEQNTSIKPPLKRGGKTRKGFHRKNKKHTLRKLRK